MSDIGKPLTTIEFEVTEDPSESDDEGNERRSGKRKKYRRSKTISAKSHAQSCSSLCSFTSTFKSVNNGQRSEPNVNYHTDDQGGEVVDLHLNLSQRNINDNDANTDVSCSDSPKDGGAQTGGYNSNGLKESLMSVLGKLGVWKNNSKLSRVPQGQWDSNLPPDKKLSQPTTSKYFRAFSFVENERRIRANNREYNSQFKYANNYIKTSKYSWLTFLPFNLLEQFQRIANFYFLCLLLLQLIPAISSLTPITTAIPLIGVLALTAVKDAYDDIQRHVSDSQVNNRRSKTLRNGKLIDEKWSGVQVGDVIRMENNQFIAADILLLSSSEPNGLCFIETAELDGETNLKCKQCLVETAEMGQQDDLLWNFNGDIHCEPPNNLLNRFDGTLQWKNQRYSLDNEKILLRGCVLRNTQWCYGVVIFAGKDTKLMQNSGKTKFKSTSIDRLLNFIIIGIVFFLLSICAFCTVACAIWEGLVGQYFQVYLPWEKIIPSGTFQGATVIGLLVFFSYAIVLNTVVPISLYVSVEVIRFAQSFLINWDEKMYYEKTKTAAKARTTTLNEELGQIQYIFSDKTGTLTQNIMTFNKCSINGRTYGDIIDLRTGEVVEVTEQNTFNNHTTSILLNSEEPPGQSTPQSTIHLNANYKKRCTYDQLSFCNDRDEQDNPQNVQQSSPKTHNTKKKLHFKIDSNDTHHFNLNTSHTFSSEQHGVHNTQPLDFSYNPEYEPDFKWYDQSLMDAVKSDEVHAHSFFRLLALCHTVMPEIKDGRLEYQAQSPDESALVSAARNFGFVFKHRTPNTITIDVRGRTEEYELLNILDFNNVRKRMSVILRRNNKILLYCKGADNVIYDRLGPNQYELKQRTQEHLNKFAGEGLRTLVLAERAIEVDFFNSWRIRQQEAALSLDGREDKLSTIYDEIECDMELVGVTAIEDKLQDGVPQTIANLQMAGIKIWVLTGDKQETAINIGYSCQLLTDDLVDVFVVDGTTMDEVEKQLRKFKESVKIVNTYHPPNMQTNNFTLTTNGSHSTSSAPIINIHNPAPPAISVVTFRWDTKHTRGAPDSADIDQIYENEKDPEKPNIENGATGEDVEENTGFAIVVNGHSLVYCLSSELENRFLDIASQCKAVICCRVTPLQKAMVVELIKRAKNAVTLAIGDGANDVSMIKAAHIGVGISGQEGMQAVLASDYSIAQFKYLERLLLVHGRWSYFRMCKFLRYFFYKNFAFTLCHFWYAFFCGFSAQTVFDPMYISVYNLFYTALPVLALGIFECDVSDKLSIEYPKLYTPGLTNALFNTTEFIKSVLHGVFSALVLFLIPYGTYKDGMSPNGYTLSDHMTLASVVATILILDNTAQIALDTTYWTIFNHITIWGSVLTYFVLDYFYNYVIGGPYVGSLTQAMREATFWCTTVLTVIALMVPVMASRFYFIDVKPSLTDKIKMKQRLAQIKSRQSTDVLRTPSARRTRRSLRSGYAFAHQEGFGRLITSGKIMRKLPQDFAFPLGLGSKKHANHTSDSHKSNHSTSTMPAGSSNDDDSSPRAPCQDLDTINL
ncbi:Phospholipid-transporting ATPase ID, partial [Pseudolycoriella hygida]